MNIKGYVPDIYTNLQDQAKPTIKQTTLISNRSSGNVFNSLGIYTKDKYDEAKHTHRQTTENTKYIGHINSMMEGGNYTRDKNEIAKPTIKQTTLYTTPGGRVNNINMGNYTRDIVDEARKTTKQTTINNNYVGNLHGEIEGKISHEASKNMETDDRREISMYNRTPNGKSDLNGPYLNPTTVRMNNRKELYNYVSHPHKSLDMSVMPTISRHTIEKEYIHSKPIIEMSGYYINNNFINTLKDNPLVNDIYHQKNV
jgi:hypothetical protein